MYDWTDDFTTQCILSFPHLAGYIRACHEEGDMDKLMTFLMAIEFENRVAA